MCTLDIIKSQCIWIEWKPQAITTNMQRERERERIKCHIYWPLSLHTCILKMVTRQFNKIGNLNVIFTLPDGHRTNKCTHHMPPTTTKYIYHSFFLSRFGLVWFFIFIVHFIHFDWSKWLSICSIAESPVTSYEYDDDNFLEQYHQI